MTSRPEPTPSAPRPVPEVLSVGGAGVGASVLPGGLAPTRGPRRTARIVAVALGAVAVAGVAAAGAVVAAALHGGGDQPEAHLPGSAVAFVKIDFDPAAGQKLDAVRFLRTLPELGDDLSQDTDVRRWLYERFAGEAPVLPWSQVEPWLGDRVGVAVLPELVGGEPVVVGALQVNDEDAARLALQTGLAGRGGVVVRNGWAVVAADGSTAEKAAAQAQDSPLSGEAQFAADLEAVGEDGVAAVWSDLGAVADLVEQAAPDLAGGALPGAGLGLVPGAGPGDLTGRVVAVLRFDGATLELAGTVRDGEPGWVSSTPNGLAGLPGDAVVAASVSLDPAAVERQWTRAVERLTGAGITAGMDVGGFVAEAESALGVALPEDLVALLGTQVSVAAADLTAPTPQVGVRSTSAPGRDPRRALDAVLRKAGDVGLDLERRDVDGGYVVASTPRWAEAMAADGGLGSLPAVQRVLPGLGSAQWAFYVDLAALAGSMPAESAPADPGMADPGMAGGGAQATRLLTALGALGVGVRRDDERTASFTVRVGAS